MVLLAGPFYVKKHPEQAGIDATDVGQRETEGQRSKPLCPRRFRGGVKQQHHGEGNSLPETLLRKQGQD